MDRVRVNPFIARMHVTFGDKVKFVFGFILLMPIRMLLLMLLIVLCSLVGYLCVLINYIIGNKDLTYAQSKFKRFCLMSVTSSIFELAMFVAGLKVTSVDKRSAEERSKNTGIMIAAPHSSHFDFGAMLNIGPKTAVAKREDQWNPFFGSLLVLSNAILVKRNDDASRHQVIKEIKQRSQVEEVGLFPEATVTNGSSLVQFKPGGFLPGLPVSPLLVQYTYQGTINTITWTWRSLDLFSLWILSCSSWTRVQCTLTFLPVYYPNEEEKQNAILFADNVRQLMSKELSIPCSRYSFEEAFFLEWATKAKISLSPVSLKFVKLTHKVCKQQAELVPNDSLATDKGNPSPINGKNGSASGLVHRKSIKQSLDSGNGGFLAQGAGNGPSSSGQASQALKGEDKSRWSHQQVFKYMVSESLSKLDDGHENSSEPRETRNGGGEKWPLCRRLAGKDDLVSLLAFPFNGNENNAQAVVGKLKAALGDLFTSLQLTLGSHVTAGHLVALLHLSDTRVTDVWLRIDRAISALSQAGLDDEQGLLTILWYFVGLEPDLIDRKVLDQFDFSASSLKTNLIETFKSAVEDNCAHLLK
ncbi:Lysophosphatidylcholine acyltransferase 2 [Halotydeus destructor]|nr:Lysophosphatidylcholine acyltransferase 2 [Halotydeus destructor]